MCDGSWIADAAIQDLYLCGIWALSTIADLEMFLAFRPDDELRAEAEAMLSDLQDETDADASEE